MNGKGLRNCIKFLIAYVSVTGIAAITGYGITRIDLLLPFCIVLLFLLLDFVDGRFIAKISEYGIKDTLGIRHLTYSELEREIKYMLPLSLLFALGVVVGRHIDVWGGHIDSFEDADIVYFLCMTLVSLFFMIVLLGRIGCGYVTDSQVMADEDEPQGGIRRYVLRTVIFLICWMPYYLTLFPGNMGNDTFESVNMCLGNIPWTNHHPIFFTAIIGTVLKLTGFIGDLRISLGILSFVHMTLFACTLSYIVTWLERRGKKGILFGRISAVFFAIHPIMPMYSIYITKDVLFSCAMVLLVLRLIDIGSKPTVTDLSLLTIWIILVMLLRNNGIIIAGLLAVILMITGKLGIKNTLLAIVIPMGIFLVYRTVAYGALGIEKESFAESAAIPLQQIGYVIDTHTDKELGYVLSEEDDEILYNIMPYDSVRRVYELGYVDPYKFDKDFDDEYFNEHRSGFLRAWWDILPKYLPEYVMSYLAQTAGYWHYGETNTVATQGIIAGESLGVERIDLIEYVTHISLYGVIEKLMLGMRKAPMLCILSSMAMQFYAVIMMLTYVLCRKEDRSCVIAYLPLILLWITVMIAAPAFCLFRYMFPFFILWPVTVYFIIPSSCSVDKA